MTTPAPDQALNSCSKVTIVTDAKAVRSRVASSWLDLAKARRDTPQGVIMIGAVAACAIIAYADGWVTPDERRRMLGLWTRKRPGSCDTPG